MFCKNCGKDIKDSKFCPHCGTKAGASDDEKIVTAIAIDDIVDAIPINDEEPVSQTIIKTDTDSVNQGGYASTTYTEQKSKVFEKYKSTSKIFSIIFMAIVFIGATIVACVGLLIAFTTIDYSELPTNDGFRAMVEVMMTNFIPLFAPIFTLASLVGAAAALVNPLILRSMVIKNRLSPSELLPYTLENGQYVIKKGQKSNNYSAWMGISFIEHPQAIKYIFANLIVSIAFCAIDVVLSLIYSVELISRSDIISGLPNEELLGLFVTPSLILLFLSVVVRGIVNSILNSKTQKCFEEIKTKYSK